MTYLMGASASVRAHRWISAQLQKQTTQITRPDTGEFTQVHILIVGESHRNRGLLNTYTNSIYPFCVVPKYPAQARSLGEGQAILPFLEQRPMFN